MWSWPAPYLGEAHGRDGAVSDQVGEGRAEAEAVEGLGFDRKQEVRARPRHAHQMPAPVTLGMSEPVQVRRKRASSVVSSAWSWLAFS